MAPDSKLGRNFHNLGLSENQTAKKYIYIQPMFSHPAVSAVKKRESFLEYVNDTAFKLSNNTASTSSDG